MLQGRLGIVLLVAIAGDGELVPHVAVQLEPFVEGLNGLSSVKAGAEVTLDRVDSSRFAGQVLAQGKLCTILTNYLSCRMKGGFVAVLSMVSTQCTVVTRVAARSFRVCGGE